MKDTKCCRSIGLDVGEWGFERRDCHGACSREAEGNDHRFMGVRLVLFVTILGLAELFAC